MVEPNDSIKYAGFWIRVGAAIIDTIILAIIFAPITIFFFGFEYYTATDQPFIDGWLDVVINWLLPMIVVIAFWVKLAGTPGKLVLKLQIVDAATGEKITPVKGFLRYIGYFIAMIPIFIGIIWVAFDSRKQGWHDKIAGTVVVYK